MMRRQQESVWGLVLLAGLMFSGGASGQTAGVADCCRSGGRTSGVSRLQQLLNQNNQTFGQIQRQVNNAIGQVGEILRQRQRDRSESDSDEAPNSVDDNQPTYQNQPVYENQPSYQPPRPDPAEQRQREAAAILDAARSLANVSSVAQPAASAEPPSVAADINALIGTPGAASSVADEVNGLIGTPAGGPSPAQDIADLIGGAGPSPADVTKSSAGSGQGIPNASGDLVPENSPLAKAFSAVKEDRAAVWEAVRQYAGGALMDKAMEALGHSDDPIDEAIGPADKSLTGTIGDWLNDKVTDYIVTEGQQVVASALIGNLSSGKPDDPLSDADRQLWNAASPTTLFSKIVQSGSNVMGLKDYLSDVQDKFSQFFGLVTSQITGMAPSSNQ